MKKITLITVLTFCVGVIAFAAPDFKQKKDDALSALAAKYMAATSKEKPALEKDLKKQIEAEENKKILLAKENLRRAEEKVKAMKENLAKLEKEKNKRVAEKLSEIKKGNLNAAKDNEGLLPVPNVR